MTTTTDPFGWPCTVSPGVARLTPYVAVPPHPAQRVFLMTTLQEVFYGGAAGGAKSFALLSGALQFVDVPGYAALILRRTFTDLSLPGALLDVARDWLGDTDAREDRSTHTWHFPSSATLTFGYLETEKDKQRYRGAAFQYIAFDELTQFTLSQYRFLFSRLRRPAVPCSLCRAPTTLDAERWVHVSGDDTHEPLIDMNEIDRLGASQHDGLSIVNVPLRMRSGSNPGDVGHAWVHRRFVDSKTRAAGAAFIPSRLEDNPSLDAAAYERALRELDPVNYQRFRRGDWDVRDPGSLFYADRLVDVDHPWPRERRYRRVRYWDMASTAVKNGNDPDETVGVLLALDSETGLERIEHIVAVRAEPHDVERHVAEAAARDGRDVPIWIEEEPGASGKSLVSHYRRNVLRGYRVEGDRPTGPKETRIRLVAPTINNSEMSIVRGPYVDAFIDQVDAYPNVEHDDQVDALAGAHARLTDAAGRILV